MVRETRHLWVGNLPENIREDRIRDHFKRYGRVQSVKLLPRGEECPVDGGSSSSLGEGNEGGSGSNSGGGGGGGGSSSTSGGASATVAFMDIKSAAKAHAIEHTLDERTLTTQYYEPQHLQPRFASHGSSEDHGSGGGSGGSGGGTGGVSGGSGGGSGSTGAGVGGSGTGERGERGSESFDSRGSHGSFYGSERNSRVVGGSSGVVVGGGVGVGGHPADPATGDPGGYISRGRPPASSYHVTSSRARDRYARSGPYITGPPPPPPHLDRHRGSLPPSSWSAYEPTGSRYGGAPPPPSPATNDAYQDEQGVGGGGGGTGSSSTLRQHKKQRRKSRSGSSSPSGSSRSGSSSSSRSGSSGGSSSGSTSPGSPVSPHRTSNVAVAEDRRPLAICVRNLPIRSSDTSLKDGLFHEYKKHGKVTWVKVVGSGDDRYALVCFKKPEDVEKALEVSQDKLFFGCKIEVAPYQGYDVEDNEFRPYEAELDEYHPKATRTLFIGNLEKDVTASELRKHFEPFGEIIEIDIKKQGAVSSYAFCQYSDIGSVVKAMRSMDGEHLGANRIKLGFGKSMPTACVWVDGIGDGMSEKYLNMQFHQFGSINQVAVDRERGHALVFFDQISCAQTAVKEMRGAALRGRRLQVDFASRECQETFYEHLERQGNSTEKTWESRPSPASSFDVTRERGSFDSAVTVSSSSSRFTRYDTPPRSRTASYSRTSGGSTPGASPAHPTAMSRSSRRSYQDSYYDGDYGEPTPRRFRSYDEFSQGSGTSHDDYQSSVLSDGKLNDDECPPPSRRHTVQSVVTSVDPPAPPPPLLPPPDIRHLQKERVHLLEQLEECQSSGDEVGFVPKKRAKLDSSSTTILCEDDEPEIASLLVTSHSNRKGMEFRRVSDSKVVVHHGTRRSSCEGRGPAPCKRRRDATSRHHEHHDGSRPGTPLVDERPENLVPSEPRRFRERSHEGPLSLPLPRFAAQMLNNNNNNSSSNNNNGSSTRLSSASLSKVASPPCASLSTAPSPRVAPQPPASPPPRHTSSSPTSSDSETASQSPTLEERIRSLDEMYEKWSGSRALSAASGDALAKLDAIVSERFRFPHKLLENDYKGVEPSEIMKSVLAKRSVFEEDSKRLENFSEKYEPREFTGVSSMIGSTAGLTTSGSCTGKVCLQYPFPSHPPVQSTSSTSVSSQVGINMSLSANLIPTTTMAPSTLKTDPRMVHICMHPTPATPITPGTSVKTVSPELPPVSLPIGLGSGTVASSGNGSGLASASSLLSSNGSVSNIHTLGASTHRGLNVLATMTAASTNTFSTAITTTAISVTTLSATTSSSSTTTTTTTTMCATSTLSSMTTTVCSVATASSIPSSSNSSSLSSSSQSSTELPRSRLKKESSGGSRDSRDSRDGKDSGRESKHNKGKDCQRRSSRKEEIDVERNRKDRDERESANVANDIGSTDIHNRDFKDNKELRYERKERDKEDRDKQERKDKEDRDRQEKKERDEREKREKDEEKRERERLDKERQEKDRREREEREKERERERKEKEEIELKEKERREKERIDREKREREEKERQERREREERERKEREERERKEREIRSEREKQEKERLRREREEQERRDKEERERLERERRREEKERLERERKREREEKERLERERRKEKEEREKAEKEKCEKEERERLEKEKHEKRREREDQERREKEKTEREKRREREEKDKEKRERDDSRRQSTENHLHSSVTQSQTQVVPAPVPVKRRCSSQDGPTDEEAKRMKISDHRRDSKDRSRQNRRSEDRKHRNDSHRSSRDSRENRDNKDSGNVIQDSRDNTHSESNRENNSRDNNGSKEKQRSKRNRSEKSRERSPRVSHESDKEYLSKLELSKRNDSSLSTESASNHTRDVQHHQQQHSQLNSHSDIDDGPLSTHEMQVTRNPSATDTDSDEPKKHSIFDIVVDEPAYISMYDKVKARSTKNMQKLEEEKRQVRLKDKFSQLKQSRARREEKKQSTSWDGDSVSSKALTEDEATSESDSTRTKSLSRKGSRSRIHSDTSEEEEPFNNKVRKPVKADRFIESDVDFNFADTDEKQNSLETSNSVVVNSVHANIKEEPRTSDEDERVSVGFRTNHSSIVNNHERDSRKKSHKKKQKRQKSSMSNENNLKIESTETLEHKTKTNAITSNADCRPNHGTELNTITNTASIVLENAEERMRADKKQRSKKDKRRDRNGEDKAKARRKRLNRQEARDSQRMEDIFGPLSDDVDDAPSDTFFNRFSNITAENNVYASDSDGGRSSLDMDRVRRKTEKKRRHQLEDENSVDLAEAGREIEAKLLGIPSSPKSAPACTEPSDHDVFRFTDDNDSIEPSTPSTVPEKVKEKKKKRKKSKEERSRKDYHHHHHHHHHHHEKSGELPYLGAEPSPPRSSSPLVLSKTIISPSLPTPRETLLSPIPKVTSSISAVTSITPPVVSSAIQASKPEKKKDKFIPGFGIEMDETIHENAVKSISEPDERDSSCQSRSGREEPELPVQTIPPTQISPDGEDKPRVAISQEETEDAVAALLEETFGASTEDFSYEGEEEEAEADGVAETPAEAPQEDVEEMQQAVESLNASTGEGDTDMKPDTPQSEHDLQIDTDTEEDPNYETVDLTQPPKTPDIPSFYKSPTKTLNMTPVLTTPEKPVEVRLSPPPVTKSQTPPTSVIAHSWTLSENNKSRESVKPTVQLETSDTDADCVTSPERTAQVDRASASPPPSQYKPMLLPCNVPITSEAPKSLPSSPRPPPITVQPLYQRLSVSPQSQMVPMRQASPKLQNPTTVSCSSSTNTTPMPPLVSSRIPSLVMSSQSSPRVTQPLSPNGQWSRNGPTLVNPHMPNIGKRKSSPPPTKIAVCMPIPAHSARPETPVQQVYSTAATQQPVIQHASGMLAPVPGYPRGGLPPLTLNIPPRPYMPVPPLASGVQVKNSRDSSLGGKSVIETLLPVNPNELPQRLEEPKLSPAVIPETTHKASTSPKVPSPNQPPTYPPETAKITANMSSPIFNKPYLTDYTMSSTMSSRQKHALTIAADDRLSPPQKLENVGQLLTTHVSRASTSPVIMTVAHGQSHLLHKSVHNLGPPPVSSPNQPLVKTVVPVVPQQVTPTVPSSMPSDKCVITQTSLACQRQSPVSQSQLVKSHVPLISTVSQSQIITRVVPSTVSSVSTSSMNEQASSECLESHVIQEQPLELDAEAQISQTVQPMLLTPPIQTTQPIDEIKQEPVEVKKEDTMEETEYNIADSKKPLNQTCVDDVKPKQELQETIKMESLPSVPKVEADDIVVPKLEAETSIKLELENEIKEENAIKENEDVELDDQPVEDPLKEPSTDPLAIDSKDDPTDSKEDSDYWSAKEVNIESVIKKVDALCDGEGNDGDEEVQQTESANSDSHDTSKNESDWFDAESAESEIKKNFVSTDDHDESAETCENEVTRSRRGRAKSRRGGRGGVTTRRGRNASNVSHKRGGRSPRGSKHHVEKSKLPADVYEFHDDSEEDNAGRPRLILTIKSPGPNVTGSNAQPTTPVAAVKEVPPEEFVSPAANTRKSRRLAERDGSRNTVDDVIEDVVRGSPANKGLVSNAGNVHATRRSTRHNNTPRNATQPPVVQLTELRKSTRGSRKAARRISENNDDSGEEKPKEVPATQQETKPSPPHKEEPKLTQVESPKAEEQPAQVVASAPQKAVSLEPMTLIDPVTGMLIPMRESEEGQYIPVSTTSGQAQNTNKTLSEPRNDRVSTNSTSEAPRVKTESSPSSTPAETKKEVVAEQPPCPPTQQIQPQTSVITKSQSPAIQVTSTITVAQSSATSTPTSVVTTVIPTTAVQAVPVSSSQTKPTSLKAHVLNASKLATSTQQQQVAVTKPMPPSLPNQTIVQNIVKPPVQHVQSVQALNLQIPPGRVTSPSLSPLSAKQTVQLSSSNGKQGQPMSPVLNNTGVPPNPKQHLLQAAKQQQQQQQQQQQTTTIVNMSQKIPLNLHSNVNAISPSSRIHQPVSQPTALKGINGQPQPLNPKAHLLQAVVPPLIAGTVTSSPSQPHLVNPQPISTGVSNVRPPGPKPPVVTNTMEPQKVELPISGCIMPTTSPQARSVPMPTFEAPLHGTGATPPSGQYGLVPPHRSQSPPLPPPAHHHVNTSQIISLQSEVVNHYGGLNRGELPPHYLHSQMLQYSQYLRAQQEALTAPRIAYHIPGTRSPHLPLDPKLETGIEDTHSPPLELRRGTRTPQDRTTDSPQVAQVYMLGGVRLPPPPQYNAGSNPSLPGAPVGARAGYYEPPPAHLRSQYPMPASEAPPEMGRATTPERCRKHQVVTPPPYASQVPPQADTFQMLLQRYPVMWQGLLALKNDQAAVQMHFVFGNPNVARDSLPCNSDGSTPPLRIAQRMRLEQTQVEGVARKMQTDNEHCMLLALPCGRDEVDVLQQNKNLQTGFIMYLQQKQAAGIVNIAVPGSQQPAYVVHIFPSCDFAHENLARIAPDLLHRVAKIAHLLIVIATV
ncbi:protein split ends isoform X2 [Pseudomyrmex gracilis]|uniref:protein split ends isoform X2 n=1 Tax=Pseudomyrmex gracilis TaxID=219809 RepID=UPI000994BC3B|nr:protein split ends isoform X2 [Pseudomyrmex gracilis]